MLPYFTAKDYNRRISRDPFHYFRCEKCALITLSNVPANLEQHYGIDYYVLPKSALDIERGLEHEHYKIAIVKQFVQNGRLLEIGPSWGAFCLLAAREGFKVEAIEMDPRCCEFLSKTIGVRAINSSNETDSLAQAATPDVIALWHVIEHLRDPWTFLEKAATKLATDGVLVIAAPNPRSLQFYLFRKFWAHLDAPRHVHLIPPEVLRRRMAALGLHEEMFTTNDPGSLGWNEFGWRFSLANLSGVSPLRRLLRLLARIMEYGAWLIERREGCGTAYTVVFRKSTGQK